ncbi:DEAD/DEAH box helicase [Chitinispirillales bacterium ANBcel5]|uniref:DEAD/DEAH box helicase n=1 Tax=Cellulosispirillum alkaliphilum TaxID=3039283 RepID=UPI002A578CE2|nr:DEAD/DEAH box helicase [Chitinispirillales bacterium ANBcel5]
MKYQNLELDPFQTDAVEAIDRGESVIVAAPTGCGKTLIAEYAVEKSINEGKKAIYTAPIKALSNQKYRDFRSRFGEEIVGIHTGDVTINPDARLLIMTTEIFRNLILEESPRLMGIYYVIFDEIHYLDDPERGTVWEESIILAPKAIRFMCLSATVPNIKELGSWMSTVRDTNFALIEEKTRPVPLKHSFFHPKFGIMSIRSIKRKYRKDPVIRKKFLRRKPSSRRIVQYVLEQDRMPALYFCFKRRACEYNAELHMRLKLLNAQELQEAREMIDKLVVQYKLEDYERLGYLKEMWESGCAFHHAGILPAAKEIVERLFTAGYIKLLFCTETFALGVNMPARSVIFDELEKFDGVDFNYLMTREYNQMAGRAGRRGMDSVGYVYSQVTPEATDPNHLERLLYGKNEKISSRFFASYSTILNLYSQFGENIFEIFQNSFHNFRKGTFSITKAYRREEAQVRNRIRFLKSAGFLDGIMLTEKGQLAAGVSGYEIQAAELFFSGSFEECSVEQLPVIMAALITEECRSKKNTPATPAHLKFKAEKVIHKLRAKEIRHNISNPIREMDFSLAAPVFSWARGCDLKTLGTFGVPEGDLVRVLRMVIQLLRTLRDRVPDPEISDKMHDALVLVNRDVVDAQAQLEVE